MEQFSHLKKYPNYELFKEKSKESRCSSSSKSAYCSDSNIYMEVQQIIGSSSCSSLIEFTLPFSPKYPAVELLDNITDVRNLRLKACKDVVLVDGNVHKRIHYLSYEEKCVFKHKNSNLDAYYGNIKVISTTIPFSCFVNISGAQPGDHVEVEYSGPDNSCVIDSLENPVACQPGSVELYKSLREKIIIRVDLKVSRTAQKKM